MAPTLNRSSSWSSRSHEHLFSTPTETTQNDSEQLVSEQPETTPGNASANMVESTLKQRVISISSLIKKYSSASLLFGLIVVFLGCQVDLMIKQTMRQGMSKILEDQISLKDDILKVRTQTQTLSSKVGQLEASQDKIEAILDAQKMNVVLLEQNGQHWKANNEILHGTVQELRSEIQGAKEPAKTHSENHAEVLSKIEDNLRRQQDIVTGLNQRLDAADFQTGVVVLSDKMKGYDEFQTKEGFREFAANVTFPVPFVKLPQVTVALKGFDGNADKKWITLRIKVDEVHTNYFTLKALSWSDTELYLIDIVWSAFSLP